MAYCTLTDIVNVIPEKELINLTNDIPSRDSSVDEERFEAVSNDADSLINGYLRARYMLPLKDIPRTIVQIAIDVCAYRLYLRRPQKIPDHITNNYNNALTLLSDIQKGKFLLETSSEVPEASIQNTGGAYRINKTTRDKVFNDGMMSAFGLPKRRR